MHIIAGRFRGRKLKTPKGLATRPVLARVREALFSVLGDVTGLAVLDLFAGTGAVGIEALSRGAASVVFVEIGGGPNALIRGNLDLVGEHAEVIRGDALRAVARMADEGRRFHLIFADPPYEQGLSQQAVTAVFSGGLLVPGGVMAVTVRHSEEMPGEEGGRTVVFDRRYGDTRLVIYRNKEDGA